MAEAKALVHKIGRVIFQAAVRNVLKNLNDVCPEMASGSAPPPMNRSKAPQGPIDFREATRVDHEQLLRRLLGLRPTGNGVTDSEPTPGGGE